MRYIVGCSYVMNWKNIDVFDMNFGCAGADNTYIHHKTVSECIKNKPSYVFIIFTGLIRTSYCIHPQVSKLFQGYDYIPSIDEESLILSGGWGGGWTRDRRLNPIFKPAYISQSSAHLKQKSIISIIACLNFLDSQDIPYDFTFAYDPLEPEEGYESVNWGSIDEYNPYYENIPKQNYLDKPFLFNYAKDNNMFLDDGIYPTPLCYDRWFNEIKHKLKI